MTAGMRGVRAALYPTAAGESGIAKGSGNRPAPGPGYWQCASL